MPPPSPLAIATSSVHRLVKEEASYHKELVAQEARLEKMLATEDGDENREYSLRQERTAIAETKAVFQPLLVRIEDALAKLEDKLEVEAEGGNEGEVKKAREVVELAKEALKEAAKDK